MDQLDDGLELEKRMVVRASQLKVPLTASFELTPLCNCNCDMCYIRMSKGELEKKGHLLSVASWLDIARRLKELGTLFILLTGGEPLMYPGFIELYTSLREMGFILTINTNATLITEEIASLFSRLKPRRVNVTLYGTSAYTYDSLCHNRNGFEKCIQGLELLQKYNVDTKLNVSVVHKNKQDFDDILAYAQSINIPAVVNSYMFPFVRGIGSSHRNINKERLNPEQAAEYEMKYMKYKYGSKYASYCKEINVTLQKSEHDSKALGLDCRAGKSSCWINWHGMMTPCFAMDEPAVCLQRFSINDAWNYIVRQSELLNEFIECAGCKLRPVCSVCYAAAYHEKKLQGNLYYLCDMAKLKKEMMFEELSKT